MVALSIPARAFVESKRLNTNRTGNFQTKINTIINPAVPEAIRVGGPTIF